MRINKAVMAALLLAASPGLYAASVDLAAPFVCPDVSPTAMRITKDGLVMGGITYPLINANASSLSWVANSIFGGADGLSEIDVRQYDNGEIDVSYMKFSRSPYKGIEVDPDTLKLFEKASFSVENPPPYFHSKNRGCRN